MAELSYPSGMPKPETDGYAIQQQSPTVNQSSITGRSVPRRRFRTVPSFVSVKWNMSHEEALLFESWFAAESEFGGIQDGTLWFNCPLQTPNSGSVVESYEARFTGMYEGPTLWSFNRWTFTATLELRKRQIIPGAWVPFPEFTLGSSIIDYAMNQEWPRYIFDYPTYAAAFSDYGSFTDGQEISIEKDENSDGKSAIYEVEKVTGASLIADFANREYKIQLRPNGLYLVKTWG